MSELVTFSQKHENSGVYPAALCHGPSLLVVKEESFKYISGS